MDKRPTAPAKSASRPQGRAPAPPGPPIGEWIDEAACASADPEVFFAAGPESDAVAKQYCAICPVRDQCRDYALASGEEFGIWGGLSEDERKAILEEAGERQSGNLLGGAA
jgi:WhiB family redox-sensing transcriptional regulator